MPDDDRLPDDRSESPAAPEPEPEPAPEVADELKHESEPQEAEPAGGEDDEHAAAVAQLRRRTRRSLLVGGAAALAGIAGWRWMWSTGRSGGLPRPLRRALEANRALWRALYSPRRLAPTYPPERVEQARLNGDLGLAELLDPEAWRLRVLGAVGGPLILTLADVQALPPVDLVTELRCIEGWSRVVRWTGARLADFVAAWPPASGIGAPPAGYIGFETPDRGYYVGLDMATALHPQAILAWAMNGAPLTPAHGAPLRLALPIAYGIKSLKRIGTIRYTAERSPDYWAERGYDWYSIH